MINLKWKIIIIGIIIIGLFYIRDQLIPNVRNKTKVEKIDDSLVAINKLESQLIKSKQKLVVDSITLQKYKKNLKFSGTPLQRDFMKKLIDLANQYNNKVFDTTIFLIDNIDGLNELDTIQTNLFVRNDSVILKSKWKCKDVILWENHILDPYMWINENEAFQYDTRGIFVTLTVALHYSLPKLRPFTNDKSILEYSISAGLDELKKRGYEITKISYENYLLNFSGKILQFGEPEPHQNSVIWYEPAKQFVTFYVP